MPSTGKPPSGGKRKQSVRAGGKKTYPSLPMIPGTPVHLTVKHPPLPPQQYHHPEEHEQVREAPYPPRLQVHAHPPRRPRPVLGREALPRAGRHPREPPAGEEPRAPLRRVYVEAGHDVAAAIASSCPRFSPFSVFPKPCWWRPIALRFLRGAIVAVGTSLPSLGAGSGAARKIRVAGNGQQSKGTNEREK